MSWNIGVMCIKATRKDVEAIIPDVFYKSKENCFFEDVTSVNMGSSIGLSNYKDWLIIIDIKGRFIYNQEFPLNLSKRYKVKTIYVSENIIYRDYKYGLLKKGGLDIELVGIEKSIEFFKRNKITLLDEYGETIAFQIIEKEIFRSENCLGSTSLMNLKYDIYKLD